MLLNKQPTKKAPPLCLQLSLRNSMAREQKEKEIFFFFTEALPSELYTMLLHFPFLKNCFQVPNTYVSLYSTEGTLWSSVYWHYTADLKLWANIQQAPPRTGKAYKQLHSTSAVWVWVALLVIQEGLNTWWILGKCLYQFKSESNNSNKQVAQQVKQLPATLTSHKNTGSSPGCSTSI